MMNIKFERLYPGSYAVTDSGKRLGRITLAFSTGGARIWTFLRNYEDGSQYPHGEIYYTLAMARERLPKELEGRQ